MSEQIEDFCLCQCKMGFFYFIVSKENFKWKYDFSMNTSKMKEKPQNILHWPEKILFLSCIFVYENVI